MLRTSGRGHSKKIHLNYFAYSLVVGDIHVLEGLEVVLQGFHLLAALGHFAL